MEKTILTFNCGSSSIKFALINPHTATSLCSGLIENIGTASSNIKYSYAQKITCKRLPRITYKRALQAITQAVKPFCTHLCAIGHRVVHGGDKFTHSAVINKSVLRAIHQCIPLAPLHNPANLLGIKYAMHVFPQLPQVAVFDTAFHQTLPAYAYLYPLPYNLYQKYNIRRYGFHGTSHCFVARQAATILQKPLIRCALITAHLGNGCSIAAVLHGKSIDTSMGLTPLEGIMMGTRSGDVDPGLHQHLVTNYKYDINTITHILNSKSGLLGVSGISSDMRIIEKQVQCGNKRALLALDIFCYRLAKYIAALIVPLPHIDALVFTGGIGENSALVRSKTLAWLKIFGFKIAPKHNIQHGQKNRGFITCGTGPKAMVIATNEEFLIAQDTWELTRRKK